jgi:hypothetical protein
MKVEINKDDQKKLMAAWTAMQDSRANLGQFTMALYDEIAKLNRHKALLKEKEEKIVLATKEVCQKFQIIFESVRDNVVPVEEREKYQYLPDMGAFVHQSEIEKMNRAMAAQASLSKAPAEEVSHAVQVKSPDA